MTANPDDHGLLRFTTCGSVDDGKSTLIGRLLYDTRSILSDTLRAMERTSERRGLGGLDLSLLTDGLQAEREQGITIDVAYRYFSTGTRKYIIADAPGHAQYTRNMVTAASTASLAIILVDARKGILPQTRLHSYVTRLLGIGQVLVAVNKMDLLGYDAGAFARIRDDYQAFAAGIGLTGVSYIPMSAAQGDMVVERGTHLGWYKGPTLLEALESAPATSASEGGDHLRFPVQYVCRVHGLDGGAGYRGFMGRVAAGTVATGDRVLVLPTGRITTVRDVQLGGASRGRAVTGESVTLLLDDELDISRGDLIASVESPPEAKKQLDAMVCWLSETPLDPARKYLVRHTSRETKAIIASLGDRVDLGASAPDANAPLGMNDIARVGFKLAQPLFCDPYAMQRATGALIVIDEVTNDTVAAGMIL